MMLPLASFRQSHLRAPPPSPGARPSRVRGRVEDLRAAEELVAVGVVEPGELVLVGQERGGQRITAGVRDTADALLGVVGHHQLEVLPVLPVDQFGDVGGRHPQVWSGHPRRAVLVRGAVVRRRPAAVAGQDVVDLNGEVVAGMSEVDALGRPGDDPVGQRPEVGLERVGHDGHDQLLPAVRGEGADDRTPSRAARHGHVDERGEGLGRPGGGDGQVAEALAHRLVVVVDRHRPGQVRERAGLAAVAAAGVTWAVIPSRLPS